jgi:hypothetical protein
VAASGFNHQGFLDSCRRLKRVIVGVVRALRLKAAHDAASVRLKLIDIPAKIFFHGVLKYSVTLSTCQGPNERFHALPFQLVGHLVSVGPVAVLS